MRILGSTTFGSEPRQVRDYYATDPVALEKFLQAFEEDRNRLHLNIWEPACGEGNLSKVLQDRGHTMRCSDIHDYGQDEVGDFLRDAGDWDGDILTNPPYNKAKEFVQHGIAKIPEGGQVVMLLRIQFLESKGRYEWFKNNPPKWIYVHSSRIKIWKNNDSVKYPGTQPLCYAWYVWEKGYTGNTQLRWIK